MKFTRWIVNRCCNIKIFSDIIFFLSRQMKPVFLHFIISHFKDFDREIDQKQDRQVSILLILFIAKSFNRIKFRCLVGWQNSKNHTHTPAETARLNRATGIDTPTSIPAIKPCKSMPAIVVKPVAMVKPMTPPSKVNIMDSIKTGLKY